MKKKLFIVVDMQNDFVTGSLGTKEAQAIVPKIAEELKLLDKNDMVIYTQDTHFDDDYFETLEGKMLPIKHCIMGTNGWNIIEELQKINEGTRYVKTTFGSTRLADLIQGDDEDYEIHFAGVCTNICVVTNALMVRMYQPNKRIIVHADMCAGTTPEKHKMALEVMKSCQIEVVGE